MQKQKPQPKVQQLSQVTTQGVKKPAPRPRFDMPAIAVTNPFLPVQTFKELTEITVPYTYEKDRFHTYLTGLGAEWMEGMGYVLRVGESRTMFTCHLDDVSDYPKHVVHMERFSKKTGKTVLGTNGDTILGADDKAGMTILLYMIHCETPGVYVFFIGEERGRIGSEKFADQHASFNCDRCVSFDRGLPWSVITHQMSEKCCSHEFATALASQLNGWMKSFKGEGLYAPDSGGSYTDSYSFMEHIPECTNIGVGYYGAHWNDECQDMDHLENLCYSCIGVDWENLPVVRDPKEKPSWSYAMGSFNSKYTQPEITPSELVIGVRDGKYRMTTVEDWVWQNHTEAAYLIHALIERDPRLVLEVADEYEYIMERR